MTAEKATFNFEYWFTNIVSTCRLIASGAFWDVWVLGQRGITSVYSIDELFEQMMGDLHLEESIRRFRHTLEEAGALNAVMTFAERLSGIEVARKECLELEDPKLLLASQGWRTLQAIATTVVELPFAQGYKIRQP